MKYLIVTADDLGLTRGINEGIAKAVADGIVTSVNIMPTGPAFDDALSVMERLGLRHAGAHLSLTETRLLTERAKAPTLTGVKDGYCRDHDQFFFELIRNRIDLAGVYVELKAQMQRMADTGLRVTNLSTHEHIHMLPSILDILLKLAGEFNVRSVRFTCGEHLSRPFIPAKIYRKIVASYFAKGMKDALDGSGMVYADHFLGFLDSGNLGEETLLDMIFGLREGVTELVCHPGFLGPEILEKHRFHINCEKELFAITSPRLKKLIAKNDVRLISYPEFLRIKGKD